MIYTVALSTYSLFNVINWLFLSQPVFILVVELWTVKPVIVMAVKKTLFFISFRLLWCRKLWVCMCVREREFSILVAEINEENTLASTSYSYLKRKCCKCPQLVYGDENNLNAVVDHGDIVCLNSIFSLKRPS